MHLQISVDRSTVNLAPHASAWSMHVKHELLWNGGCTVYIITSHLLYSVASYIKDTAVKPGYEKESEVKDFCYLTQQFLQEFPLFQAVRLHFQWSGRVTRTNTNIPSTRLQGNAELNDVVSWFCSLHSNGILNNKIHSCSKQQILRAHV